MFALAQPRHASTPSQGPGLFLMALISPSAGPFFIYFLIRAPQIPQFDSVRVILPFSPSRLSLEDTQQWSQSLERLLESKCRWFLFPPHQRVKLLQEQQLVFVRTLIQSDIVSENENEGAKVPAVHARVALSHRWTGYFPQLSQI